MQNGQKNGSGNWYQAELVVRLCPPVVREHDARRVADPADVLKLCAGLAQADQETVVCVTVDSKNKLINRHVVTIGLVNSCQVHPREFFRRAILDGASACLMVHNHPSGDAAPSAEDVRITRQLIEAGKVLDVPLVDSVVIGRRDDGEPYAMSMAEQGLVCFGKA